jgi:hypothetical protein
VIAVYQSQAMGDKPSVANIVEQQVNVVVMKIL